ncbi:hypothetical protein [Pseudoxanthomonas taiwanensis]|uniref:Uncharacterized protein n=1 Tax=Pseudoxanthomonas taiwanensis TaxID=176598 RepID=A0A921NYS9_9GAMM|nr:hypothetical protein [Pseudoxanthomonas taiwanensis]KAF1689467.1 hypothetical protein CR938_05550 [Pseudoxanthomonas taiwanensis]
MKRILFWGIAAAVAAAAIPVLAQKRQSQSGPQAAPLADHKAQEQREREEAAERARRREAARAGRDARAKGRPQREEEEEDRRRPPA